MTYACRDIEKRHNYTEHLTTGEIPTVLQGKRPKLTNLNELEDLTAVQWKERISVAAANTKTRLLERTRYAMEKRQQKEPTYLQVGYTLCTCGTIHSLMQLSELWLS